MNKIILYIIAILILPILIICFGLLSSVFLFDGFFSYLAAFIILTLFIFLIKKKKYLLFFYLFLLMSGVYIYGYTVYTIFFNTKISEKEKIEMVKKLEEKCGYEDTGNPGCKGYFILYNKCKEKNAMATPIDCKEIIINGSIICGNI